MGNLFRSLSSYNQPLHPSVLLEACMANDVGRVKRLVGSFLGGSFYASRQPQNRVGYVKQPDVELVSFVNAVDSQGNAAIHASVFQGNLDLVQFLVEKCGALLHKKNKLGCWPLWLAAGYDRRDVLEYLLNKMDHDPLNNLLETNSSGDTPLLAAASRGNTNACQMLMEHAKGVATSNGDKSGNGQEEKEPPLVHRMLLQKNRNGDTPFSVAVAGGHVCGIGGASRNTGGVDGNNSKDKPTKGEENNLLDMLLLPHCADEMLNTPNRRGLTPLLVSCERDWLDVFQKLLERGASIGVCDAQGATSLAVAVFCGSKDITTWLLQQQEYKDKLLNVPNKSGCTPLWLSARTGNATMVKVLLRAGADSEISNADGQSPLHIATIYQKQDVVKVLQEHTKKIGAERNGEIRD